MGNLENSYNSEYNDHQFIVESPVITLLKGMLGALVGAVPGFLLCIIVGKMGYIASICGAAVALGAIFGYHFMTVKGDVHDAAGVVICAVVCIFTVFIANKIVWIWEMSDVLEDMIPDINAIEMMIEEEPSLTRSQCEELISEEIMEEALYDTYGVRSSDFGECYSNFSLIIDKTGLKKSYTSSLWKSYLFAAMGIAYLFVKK
jgi:hypothetical protein